ATWFDVWIASCNKNLFESLPAIHCPVYFFAGERDFNTNSSITEEYYNKVTAPKKKFFLFNTGHTVPEADPTRFQNIIIDEVLPDTYNP
ncbi:MAG TPA: alpha/beta hydrolase, partial [Chitinophagaceae bacterium]